MTVPKASRRGQAGGPGDAPPWNRWEHGPVEKHPRVSEGTCATVSNGAQRGSTLRLKHSAPFGTGTIIHVQIGLLRPITIPEMH